MANDVLVYSGGGVPETETKQRAVLAAWGSGFEALGQSVVDDGNPFGPSASVASDGAISQGAPSALSGYTIISADSLDAVTGQAKGCPILDSGDRVDVYETFQVM